MQTAQSADVETLQGAFDPHGRERIVTNHDPFNATQKVVHCMTHLRVIGLIVRDTITYDVCRSHSEPLAA
jgi:hypothetical protein